MYVAKYYIRVKCLFSNKKFKKFKYPHGRQTNLSYRKA